MYYNYITNIEDNIRYKVGVYYRLSREDGDNLESESISNQRSLIQGFAKGNNMIILEEYIDDGFSGGNFDRPDFQRMIRDVESGRIDCIITKDLSRLGRDYIETGRYIERYFPEHNVRYIAINDDIDTIHETGGMEVMPFKLSMNDSYARDISKKVRSNLLIKKRNGEYCGSVPSYGYMRDPKDKHKLIPDPNTSFVVKRIFDLYIAGYSTADIADILTREELPTPIVLKNKNTLINKADHPEIWKRTSINNILRNEIYTGTMIQHKAQNINYKTKKRRAVPKEEWCRVENTHEALVDKKTFDMVQTIRQQNNRYNQERRCIDYILSGLLYCKDCGAKMQISYDKVRDRITVNCGNYRKFHKYGICFSHYMNYTKLESTIYSKISEMSSKYVNDKEAFLKTLRRYNYDPKEELEKKIRICWSDIERNHKKQDSLYDDKFSGVITAEQYQRLSKICSTEIEQQHDKLIKYNKELDSLKDNIVSHEEYNKVIDEYLSMKNPTKEMMRRIIDKVYINKDKTIEIVYKILCPNS